MNRFGGEQAIALGAINGGVSVITGYPGSPSSATMSYLIDWQSQFEYHIEWSTNEKVAIEVAIGASIGGVRSLVCVKSVGMNLMVDPLMALNLTPLNGGLVILLGDDPGGYGSQNDQDTRPMVHMLEIPIMEPGSPEEGMLMMSWAFQISEDFQLPVIIRITRSFSQQTSHFHGPPIEHQTVKKSLADENTRFVPAPFNAVQKHSDLQRRLDELGKLFGDSSFNSKTLGGKKGVIASGYVYQKLMNVIDNSDSNLSILKINTLFPVPEKSIVSFLNHCDEVLVLEETLPFMENIIKVVAYEKRMNTKILGKKSGHIPSVGELYRWQINEALKSFEPGILIDEKYTRENEHLEKPKKGDPCADSRYEEVIDLIDSTAQRMGQKPIYLGDPGCIFKVGEKILAKYAIGSAVAIGSGLAKTATKRPIVALIGDSGFFHTTAPAIINATQNGDNVIMVVLDNGAAKTSGGQPTPASPKDIFGNKKSQLSIMAIARACGIEHVSNAHINERESFQTFIAKAIILDEPSMVIVKIE